MRYVLQIGLFFTLFVCAGAQPSIQWQRCFGGSEGDIVYDIHQFNDSSYILTGLALSADGNVTNIAAAERL